MAFLNFVLLDFTSFIKGSVISIAFTRIVHSQPSADKRERLRKVDGLETAIIMSKRQNLTLSTL